MTRPLPASDRAIIIVSLGAGAAWRLELELRWGWQSLAWIDEFHWAVPVSIALCIAWAVRVAPVRERAMFAGVLTALAVMSYVAVSFCFPFYFASGPVAFAKIMLFGKLAEAADLIAPVLWGCIPLVFCYICRFFGAPVTLPQALTSAILFVLSWPIAILVPRLFEEKGSPDAIHALKSGFVIPFLIISLAYPLMRISSRPGGNRIQSREPPNLRNGANYVLRS